MYTWLGIDPVNPIRTEKGEVSKEVLCEDIATPSMSVTLGEHRAPLLQAPPTTDTPSTAAYEQL